MWCECNDLLAPLRRRREHTAARIEIDVDRFLGPAVLEVPRFDAFTEEPREIIGDGFRTRAELVIDRECLERVAQIVRGLVASLGRLRDAAHDDLVELARKVSANRRRCRDLSFDDHRHCLIIVRALEQAARGRELVEHRAEREDVAAPVKTLAQAQLGRHVRRFAERPGVRVLAREGGLREPEVDELHAAVVSDQDVARRHIAMDEVEWLAIGAVMLVRVVQARGCRCTDRHDLLDRDQRIDRVDLREHAAEVLAVDVLHREEVAALRFVDVEDLDDVVMVKRGADARFFQKRGNEPRIDRVLGSDLLDHDVALKPLEPTRAGEEHIRDIPTREALQDLVAAEL